MMHRTYNSLKQYIPLNTVCYFEARSEFFM